MGAVAGWDAASALTPVAPSVKVSLSVWAWKWA
jgi:hypothetical protein